MDVPGWIRHLNLVNCLLLHAPMSPSASPRSWETALLRASPYARRLELERRAPAGRHASLLGTALALLGSERIAGAGASASQLQFEAGKRPFLRGGPCFSVSHSETHVACVVSGSGRVGIDIEPRSRIDARRDEASLRRWTATEAALKTAGLGVQHHARVQLAPDLGTASIDDIACWLQELGSIEGHVCHVASTARLTDVVTMNVDTDGPELSAAVERSLRARA